MQIVRKLIYIVVFIFSTSVLAQHEAEFSPSEVFSIKGIPPGLQDKMISDQRDIADVVNQLQWDFRFHFVRRDSNETRYIFRQFINDIWTDNEIEILVDNETRRVKRYRGKARRDTKTLKTKHALSEKQATRKVLNYLKHGGERAWGDMLPFVKNGDHESLPLYRGKELWWGIGIETDGPAYGEGDPDEMHEWYWVSPSGEVEPWQEGATDLHHVTICDGSSSSTPWCSGGLPTVINTSGTCQSGYTCTGTDNEYQVPYDIAHDVEDMWGDIHGATNTGTNNAYYGGDIEINVGGTPISGAPASYTAAVIGPQQRKRAVMIVDEEFAHFPTLISHEMGHAYHAKVNWSTYKLSSTTGGTLSTRREHRAVKEAIAEINSVLFQNYTGSGFSVPADYVTGSGHDYEAQFNHSQISGSYTDYKNARVAGHAFYDLAEAAGFEVAAKIFLQGVVELSDDDSSGKISFEEMREGQIDAAEALNLSAGIINAVKNAWNDVGIGAAGTGATIQLPGATPPSGSPSAPSWVTATLGSACLFPWTVYNVSYQNVSNETYYDVFHKFSGGGWELTGSTNSNPQAFYVTATADVTIRACNASGCSALSNDTETATYLC